MIVLHVARARTDSINIRGSLGKTRAALWITGATFLYFSGCNAHTPFTLFSFLRLYSPVVSVRSLLPFHDPSLPARHRSLLLSFSLSPVHRLATALSLVRTRHRFFRSLSLFHS